MKKFLTVLLALSVVFTYTVGTAFADVGTNDVYTQATNKAAAQLTRVEAAGIAWTDGLTYTPSNVDVDKELKLAHAQVSNNYFVPTGIANLKAAIVKKASDLLDAKVAEIVKRTYVDQAALDTALKELETVVSGYVADFSNQLTEEELKAYSLEDAKKIYTDFVNSFNELDYAATPDDNGVINRDEVIKLKAKAVEDIANATNAYFGPAGARDIANTFFTEVKKIDTIADAEDAFKTLEEEKAYYASKIESEIIAKKADVKYALNQALNAENKKTPKDTVKIAQIEAALASIDADFDAAIESAKAEIGLCKRGEVAGKYTTWNTIVIPGLGYDAEYKATGYLPTYAARAIKVSELKKLAADMKAETGFNGEAAYDSTEVDEALEADLEAVYTNGVANNLSSLSPIVDLVKAEMNRVITAAEITLDKIKYPGVNAWANSNNYDEANLEKVEAIAEETKAAIRDAKTVADVDAAFKAGYEKFYAVPKLADLAKYQNSAAGKAAIDKYDAKLDADLLGKIADYGTTQFAKDYESTDGLVGRLVNEYLKKAYDAADMEAKYQEALAEITNLKSKAELKAEADAINAEILALSKETLTAADEEKVLKLAEREANFTAYKTLIGATGYVTYGTDTYKNKVKALVKKELETAKKAIGTVTVEDEAAINELAAKVEAFEENYDKSHGIDIATLKKDLVDAKTAALNKAIGVIDASANPLDVAAIEAARTAYDALGENAVKVNPTMYHKLLSLENLVNEYEAKAVEALKITASSKAGKGYIKVTWKVKGNAATADGFQVYRSTKRNSGFGTKPYFTAKAGATSYKNTKSLKKGTRYYYKVRAYKVVDGKNVYSDWSNKAYRIAK